MTLRYIVQIIFLYGLELLIFILELVLCHNNMFQCNINTFNEFLYFNVQPIKVRVVKLNNICFKLVND